MRISDWSSDVCSSDLPVTKSLFHIARYLNQNPNLSGLPIIFEMKVVVRTAPVLEHHVVARAQRLLEDAGPFDARVSLAASQIERMAAAVNRPRTVRAVGRRSDNGRREAGQLGGHIDLVDDIGHPR